MKKLNHSILGVDFMNDFRSFVKGDKFDFIIANILAEPLRNMAVDIVRLLNPNGCLVLSGILDKQADEVEKAYVNAGLGKAKRYNSGEWVALVWK